jgi:DNA-binding LacI/PurR family transcriptional regulator
MDAVFVANDLMTLGALAAIHAAEGIVWFAVIVLLLALSGVVVGMLNSFEHFSVPALAPVAPDRRRAAPMTRSRASSRRSEPPRSPQESAPGRAPGRALRFPSRA